MSVDLVRYNGGLSQDAIIGGRGDYSQAVDNSGSGYSILIPKKFIGTKDLLSPSGDPLFANEQELIDFLNRCRSFY